MLISAEKEKLTKLMERIDELLLVLKRVSEDLRAVSTSVKAAVAPQDTPHLSTASAQVSLDAPAKKQLEDVRMAFPQDLEHLLAFKDEGDYLMIKPKKFLGSENFAKIASAVRGMGGEYISAGRDSHFRVYKKKP